MARPTPTPMTIAMPKLAKVHSQPRRVAKPDRGPAINYKSD